MFAPGSRYARVPTGKYVDPAGVEHPYVLLRPFPAAAPPRGTHVVADGERLDLIAARFLGDPEQFWRLCDANRTLRPEDLEVAGQSLLIPLVTA
jgi:hypothetical protein